MREPFTPRPSRRQALALLASALPLAGAKAASRVNEIVVITSFPASLYEPFRMAFERMEPGIRLRILNRKTTAALAMVEDGRLGEVDLFWASAPDAFEVLKGKGLLLPLAESAVPAATRVQGYPVDDPDGLFRGFSISGYGLSWNRARLQEAGIAPPKSVADLADPAYRDRIAMSAPSRSGTTHLMVETILQRYGWEQGWRIWLEIAANLANIAARSFSVASGVTQGRYAIGLSIDFLGRGHSAESGVGFIYPSENVFLPASIALVRGGRNPDGARRFARFVLSEAGQRLLLHPAIQRQPVMPAVIREMPAPPLPLDEWPAEGHRFDAGLSGQRYELVNVIFDELVTEQLVNIQRFWRGFSALAPLVPGGSPAADELAAIARLAVQPPDSVLALGRLGTAPKLRRIPRGAPVPVDQAQLIDAIRSGAEARRREAEARLDQLANRLSAGGAPALPRRTP